MELPVLVTYSNMGYFKLAKNLLLNLEQKLSNHMVHFYCLDNEILNHIQKMNLNLNLIIERYETDVSSNAETYGSTGYNKITHTKISILKDALSKYKWIHFIDCDVVCCKEPSIDYWNKYAEYDIVFQYDAGFISRDQPHWPYFHIWACTGNTLLKRSTETLSILDIILHYQKKYPSKNDQECLYEFFIQNGFKSLLDVKIAKLYEFPPNEFTNGYWVKHDIGGINDTYFFHANHTVGIEEKLKLFKKINLYYLEEENILTGNMFKQTFWNDYISSNTMPTFMSWVEDSNAESKQYLYAYLKGKQYKNILDMGCGTGTIGNGLKQHNIDMEYTGVDSCKYFVEACKSAGHKIIESDIRDVKIDDSGYDIVFGRHVLEHQDNFNDLLSEMIRIGKHEIIHIFFIKPIEGPGTISYDAKNNLFHNQYSMKCIDEALINHPKVEKYFWVDINKDECALHVHLIG